MAQRIIKDIVPELRGHIARKYGSQAEAARALGISRAYVSIILQGKKAPTKEMLEDAGIERTVTVTYRTKDTGKRRAQHET